MQLWLLRTTVEYGRFMIGVQIRLGSLKGDYFDVAGAHTAGSISVPAPAWLIARSSLALPQPAADAVNMPYASVRAGCMLGHTRSKWCPLLQHALGCNMGHHACVRASVRAYAY